MSDTITLFLPGQPKAKQGGKHYMMGNGRIGKYQPKDVQQAKSYMRAAALSQLPKGFKPWTADTALVIHELDYVFPYTRQHLSSKAKKQAAEEGVMYMKTSKPDIDNLTKNLLDAMQGLILTADQQICSIRQASKWYGANPGIRLKIGPAPENELKKLPTSDLQNSDKTDYGKGVAI